MPQAAGRCAQSGRRSGHQSGCRSRRQNGRGARHGRQNGRGAQPRSRPCRAQRRNRAKKSAHLQGFLNVALHPRTRCRHCRRNAPPPAGRAVPAAQAAKAGGLPEGGRPENADGKDGSRVFRSGNPRPDEAVRPPAAREHRRGRRVAPCGGRAGVRPCWAPTAPANRPRSKCSAACCAPTGGSIMFEGRPWQRDDLYRIGSLIETPPLYPNLTAAENLGRALHAARHPARAHRGNLGGGGGSRTRAGSAPDSSPWA